ncbi:ANTAR domain-containing protein [Rhodococcus globerulus]|nr:ANTAR domain-containing protein [Rhodococcus globerulus]
MYNTMIHPDNTTNSVTTNELRVPTTSGRLRARALEIVCTLYRCTTDEAADLLVRHSQTNNLKVTSLIKALVALIDEDTSGTGYGSNNALASHFWLREIRNLSQAHRRSDHFHRHLVGA